MDEHQVIEVLELVESATVQELDNTKEMLGFITLFMKKYRYLEEKLPYCINVIDEIGAIENAHSRILAKLFQQKTTYEKYEIFESFIRYIQEKYTVPVTFQKIKVTNPEITQEIGRIDLWIRDEDYAIVIENKIHWAKDMDKQLVRYINTTKKRYEDEQIYVIYLSPTYDKKPDEQTWGDYIEKYKDRFLRLSFREDILTWLTENVLPNVRLKDKFPSSALEQYIDHLKGKFALRNINNKMNMELQELIKQEWKLYDTSQKNIAELLAKKEIINKINLHIDLSIKDFEKTLFHELKTSLKAKYTDYDVDANETSAWVLMKVKDKKVRVWIQRLPNFNLNCGIDRNNTEKFGEELPKKLLDNVEHLLPGKDEGYINNYRYGRGIPRGKYDEAFELMLEVIEVLKSIDNENS